MAQQLLEAARLGDVEALESMLRDDPLILERVAFLLPFAETPLHIASLAGKTNFARKIVSLKPSFAKDLNKDGLSALHIASALGHVQIVSLLLTLPLDTDLCLLKDNNGRTSLHHAAIRGRTDVIKELLTKCPQALKEVTAEDDTALHLAVKNQQYEALRTLVEWLRDDSELINAKNKDGFSMYQLAKATGQLQVLDLLDRVGRGLEAVHAAAAANENRLQPRIRRRKRQPPYILKLLFDALKSTYDDQSMLIIAVLIATVTFQSFLTPPATLWKEKMNLDYRCVFLGSGYWIRPLSKIDCPTVLVILFLFFNTTGFLSSFFVLILFKRGASAQILIAESIFSLLICYVSLTGALLPDFNSYVLVGVAMLLLPLPVVLYLMVKSLFKYINDRTKESS